MEERERAIGAPVTAAIASAFAGVGSEADERRAAVNVARRQFSDFPRERAAEFRDTNVVRGSRAEVTL